MDVVMPALRRDYVPCAYCGVPTAEIFKQGAAQASACNQAHFLLARVGLKP